MSKKPSKAELFDVMGLGPVWELKAPMQPNGESMAADSAASLVSSVSTNQTQCQPCQREAETPVHPLFSTDLVVVVLPVAGQQANDASHAEKADRLLDRMLSAIGRTRGKDVCVARLQPCKNLALVQQQGEVPLLYCEGVLEKQVIQCQPSVVMMLGKATPGLLSNLGAKVIESQSLDELMRTPALKAKAWSDLLAVKSALAA